MVIQPYEQRRIKTLSSTSNFNIDITQYINAGPVHWSVPDNEPAFCGRMFKEVDTFGKSKVAKDGVDLVMERVRKKGTKTQRKRTKAWKEQREERGLPPWVSPETSSTGVNEISNPEMDPTRTNVLLSSKTLREWADEYCDSTQQLKEFTYQKVSSSKIDYWLDTKVNDILSGGVRLGPGLP